MKNLVLILFAFLLTVVQSESRTITIQFEPSFGNQELLLDELIYYNDGNDSLEIETLKLYISNLIINNTEISHPIPNSYHLVNSEEKKSLKWEIEIPSDFRFNSMSFNIGIDSVTNSSGVFSGDLDPTTGMYWTWQSGYINFKLEGTSLLSPMRKNKFEYHLGGFSYPNNTIQKVELEVNNKDKIIIKIDVSKFINGLDISTINKVMSPGQNAVELSKLLPPMFSITN